jgi:8-oxo-dGTP diphosphatase
MPHTYDYPRPAVTVDALVALRGAAGRAVEVLLVRRAREPFRGTWALPGGFVEPEEDLLPAARRELEEETGLAGVALEQFRAYGAPGRDPRGRTISIVFAGLLEPPAPRVEGRDDAAEARFFAAGALPPLAFDHAQIVAEGLRWLAARAERGEI